ncbi:MAG: hypothetical protein NT062_10005, partial [Proteobacteria bacterium]|nr:hypothetical protein [Pseudomonadota bacterium]
ITSPQVFTHLQAPFRAEIAARAELAELARAGRVAEQRAATELATRTQTARTEAEATEVETREATRRADMAAAVARREVELHRDRMLQQIQIAEEQRVARAAAEVAGLAAEVARVEATQRAAAQELAHARTLQLDEQVAALELRQRVAEVDLALRRRETDARAHEAQLDAAQQRQLAEIEQALAHGRALHALVTTALPAIAGALKPDGGTVHYTQIGGDATTGPLGAVPAALAQLLALARSFGLELPIRER